jgi:hypothetical protein
MMSDPDMKNAEHIEQQPVPGHTENIPSDGSDERRDGESGTQRLEDVAPSAAPDTKPGTPPGTQSDADRTRSPDEREFHRPDCRRPASVQRTKAIDQERTRAA